MGEEDFDLAGTVYIFLLMPLLLAYFAVAEALQSSSRRILRRRREEIKVSEVDGPIIGFIDNLSREKYPEYCGSIPVEDWKI